MDKSRLGLIILKTATGFLLLLQASASASTAVEAANAEVNRCSELFLQTTTSYSINSVSAAQDTTDLIDSIEQKDLIHQIDPIDAVKLIIHDLAILRGSLDLEKARGSRSLLSDLLEDNYVAKMQELVEYIEDRRIVIEGGLDEKIQQEIGILQGQEFGERRVEEQAKDQVERRRNEQLSELREAIIDGTRAVFHRVEPGSFLMGEPGKQVSVKLTKPFEMMATPTTHLIWNVVAELANRRFAGRYKFEIKPPRHIEDRVRPIVLVSFVEIQTWIRALNDLSQTGEPELVDLIRGHKTGDAYRLPTEAEWEFVVRGRGVYKGAYHYGNDESQLRDYAWIGENSGIQAQPVARKLPVIVDDKKFYDLYGNVWEFVSDKFQEKLRGGANPRGPLFVPTLKGQKRVARGGGWRNRASILSAAKRVGMEADIQDFDLGFRLVREVEPEGFFFDLKKKLSVQ